jgi:hypothetical protein
LSGSKISRTHHQATFKFAASGNATGFGCALVKLVKHPKAPHFSACRSPKRYTRLAAGRYEFFVRAFNGSGHDPSPSTVKFTI